MPIQSNYSCGRDTKYTLRDLLILHVRKIVHSAGSHTTIDLVARQDGGHPFLIRVKRNIRYHTRTRLVELKYPSVIRILREIPRPIKADVEQWVWAPLKGCQYYSIQPKWDLWGDSLW